MFDTYDDAENFYNEDDDELENDSQTNEEAPKANNFLGIMFNCCGVYSRIYKNKEGTAYVGRCPKCLKYVKIPVGEGGTSQRFFTAE